MKTIPILALVFVAFLSLTGCGSTLSNQKTHLARVTITNPNGPLACFINREGPFILAGYGEQVIKVNPDVCPTTLTVKYPDGEKLSEYSRVIYATGLQCNTEDRVELPKFGNK